MDNAQLKFVQQVVENARKEILTDEKVKEANPSKVEKILDQRHKQREILFNLAKQLTECSFMFIVGITFLHMLTKILLGIELFTGYILQIIAVAVFGQIIGIILIIANSIWNDKPYSDHLGMDYMQNHKNDH